MKLLLINPGSPDDIDSRITREIPYLFAANLFSPHAVAAVAALTPPGIDVEIHDEYTRGPVNPLIEKNRYDIIGITITSNQLRRSRNIARFCREVNSGATLVAGGIGVEHFINQGLAEFDVVFHGEAEETWPRFIDDFIKGNFKPVYKNLSKPDMTKTPAPRWELMKQDLASYTAVLVQTTRGCPFDCSFCDVIYTYGRKPRSKTIAQVLDEVKKLQALKTKMIFIGDDNFAGNRQYAKELLRQLIPLNNSFRSPIEFLTQIDITIADDEELLTMLADCNFQAVMIGIESVSEASLRDFNKQQNMRMPVAEAVRKIQSYGIVVLAHMIIGADSDDRSAFSKTAEFITEASIVHHLCHPLAAPPGTKMWYALKREGRIISTDSDEISDKLDIISNIIPKKMTRVELFEGLADYWEDIYDPEKFSQRAIAFIDHIRYKPAIREKGLRDLWILRKMLFRVLTYFMFDAGKEHRKAFFSILARGARKGMYLMPKIIYLYTSYLVDYKRSMHDAGVARKHARWEKENPGRLVTDASVIPVAEKIREHAGQLFTTAYHHVREKVSTREILYSTVVEAMLDYNDRFGEHLDAFDRVHEEHVRNSCDRSLNLLSIDPRQASGELPATPPPGFTREMLDALDNAARYRNSHFSRS